MKFESGVVERIKRLGRIEIHYDPECHRNCWMIARLGVSTGGRTLEEVLGRVETGCLVTMGGVVE